MPIAGQRPRRWLKGRADLSRISPAHLDEIIAALEEQVVIAFQCLNTTKPS